jgi:hypothetical protein
MRRIYKYQLETIDIQLINVPRLTGEENFKSQVLNVDTQNGTPCIWCLVDVEEEQQQIKIRIIGTGNPMPVLSKDDYLGTYQLHNGEQIFHVFIER